MCICTKKVPHLKPGLRIRISKEVGSCLTIRHSSSPKNHIFCNTNILTFGYVLSIFTVNMLIIFTLCRKKELEGELYSSDFRPDPDPVFLNGRYRIIFLFLGRIQVQIISIRIRNPVIKTVQPKT